MVGGRTVRMPDSAQSTHRASLSALEILHGLHPARSPERHTARRSMQMWAIACVLSTLACWRIVAGHFALSRPLDEYVTMAINHIASQNGVINHAVHIASETTVLTGGLLIALVWSCWFTNTAKDARERLLLGFGAVLVAAVLSRLMQVSLPMRARPLHDLALGFMPLPGIDTELANHWGSFPSDHATLFFALVAVVWQRSRWLGVIALVSALYGVLPRMYLGLHYLSDVLAGAALGVALVLMFERFGPRAWARRGMGWELRFPAAFYGTAFLVCLEVATLFEDIRQAARGIPAVLKQFGI
jgi:undecaprenyl-diphosphatase